MIKKLLGCLGEYKKYAIMTPIIMIGEALMEILLPFMAGKILTEAVTAEELGVPIDTNKILYYGVIIIIMALISLTCGALGGMTAARAGMGFAKNVRKKLFDKIQDFSFGNIDHFSTSSLITRLTTDVTNTQNALMMSIRMAVRSPSMMIGAFIMAFIINKELSVVFLVAIPVLGILLGSIAFIAHPRFIKMLKKYDKLNADIQENLIGIRVVKAFVREKYEKQKFVESADALRKAQFFAEKVVILNSPIMQITMYACIVAVIWFGGRMCIVDTMDVAFLSSFITYVTQILMSLMMISMILIMIIISRASMERIVEVLDEEIEIDDTNADESLVPADGSIEFKNVNFSYTKNNNYVLENINLKINSGETIGIIGGTGSSKTTLVQLIPRLYDVTEGEILVGGKNVTEYKLENLRNDVAMVLQKNLLFSGTIKENLLWGDADATDEEIRDAANSACADEFVMSFPEKYETELGQGGVNVSGGQKQRLCIARALLKKPKIIILDDSTSAVDTATDASIRKAFKEKLADTTTIIIAQRISSVMDADKIIVMDDGKIDGIGTHNELLKTNDIYREVYESQQKGADE